MLATLIVFGGALVVSIGLNWLLHRGGYSWVETSRPILPTALHKKKK